MRSKQILALVAVLALLLVGCQNAATSGLQTPADLDRIAGQKGAAPNSPDCFRFIVMTDRNGGQETGKWAIAVDEVNRLRPDFVMCIGDLTRSYKEDAAATAKEWDEFHDENKALRAPFFYCAGNHDVLGVETRKAYARRHNVAGKPYYSFEYRGCHFAVIDTTPLAEPKAVVREEALAADQWAWLAKDLAAARTARHTFVFMHHPLWRYAGAWAKLRAMVDPARTTLFAGHTHKLDYREVDGVPCHTLAVTAAKAGGDRALGDFQMYAHVTVDAGSPAIAYMPLGSAMPLNVVDLAAEAVGKSVLDAATLSTVSVRGGNTMLLLTNSSKCEMACGLRWAGPADDLKQLPAPTETLTLVPGGMAARTYDFKSLSGGESLPALGLTYSYTLNKKPRKASRDLPLPVAMEIPVAKEGKPAMGKAPQMDGVKTPPIAWRLTYDEQNLYVDVSAADEKILTDAKEPWQRDGIEIFWNPRPADQRDGPFQGDCRQLLIPVPGDGQPAVVYTNPKDGALSKAVTAECLRGKAGYRILATVPLSAIAKDFKPAPGQSLRMDVYVDNIDDAKSPSKVIALSGKAESSRQTRHYIFATFK